MKTRVLLFLLIISGVAIGVPSSSSDSKIWVRYEGDNTAGGWPVSFYFLQDKETGTRCYALRGPDSVAINCVKQ